MLGHEAEDTLYREQVPLAPWLKALVGLILLALVGTLIGALGADSSQDDQIGLVIASAITVGVAVMAWNYRAIQIRVTQGALEVRYGLFNHTTIPFSEVTECLTTRAGFGRYLGVGVRVGLDGSWAYTTSFGPAVEVRRRSGRPFVVSTNRAQELCAVIKAATPHSS